VDDETSFLRFTRFRVRELLVERNASLELVGHCSREINDKYPPVPNSNTASHVPRLVFRSPALTAAR
jgi:hypothetical protein